MQLFYPENRRRIGIMPHITMSWQTDGDRVATRWNESSASEPYNPAWKQSSYPSEASGARSCTSLLDTLSSFGKAALFVPLTKAPCNVPAACRS
ncbi:MAG: hypothetical protein C5B58_03295 [Acidobacteria bacterium]|nr:MAG: hypothetical protein C5B58_03295 [Acidobacteriota bacterium]